MLPSEFPLWGELLSVCSATSIKVTGKQPLAVMYQFNLSSVTLLIKSRNLLNLYCLFILPLPGVFQCTTMSISDF